MHIFISFGDCKEGCLFVFQTYSLGTGIFNAYLLLTFLYSIHSRFVEGDLSSLQDDSEFKGTYTCVCMCVVFALNITFQLAILQNFKCSGYNIHYVHP